MSHELKTPLANIREGTELLMDGAVGELQSAQREVAAILRENGMKLQRLIENLLSFSAWQAKSVGPGDHGVQIAAADQSRSSRTNSSPWSRSACGSMCKWRISCRSPTAARFA
jgi:signal transduction histidine kinase